jgi:alkylated DNA repair dioxygenase AlkB
MQHEKQRTELSETSWVEVVNRAVVPTKEELKELFDACPTTRDEIVLFGKRHPLPRFQRLYGAASYSYSSMKLVPETNIPPLVMRCIEYAKNDHPESNFNGALVNWYMSGDDSIGFHADDETDLEKGIPIYSFSFGGVRSFHVKPKTKDDPEIKKKETIKFETESGLLIVMGGNMQKEFLHGVPKTKKPTSPRINVTVRALKKPTEEQPKKRMKSVDE